MKEKTSTVERVLVVSALSGAEACAAAIMQQMGLDVEVVPGRREALEALRAKNYAAVIVEDSPVLLIRAPSSRPHGRGHSR